MKMNWLKHNFVRDWHKISLQGILGMIGAIIPLLAIRDPKSAIAVATVLSGVTSSYAAYKNTITGLSQVEAQAKVDGTKAVVLTDPQANFLPGIGVVAPALPSDRDQPKPPLGL